MKIKHFIDTYMTLTFYILFIVIITFKSSISALRNEIPYVNIETQFLYVILYLQIGT